MPEPINRHRNHSLPLMTQKELLFTAFCAMAHSCEDISRMDEDLIAFAGPSLFPRYGEWHFGVERRQYCQIPVKGPKTKQDQELMEDQNAEFEKAEDEAREIEQKVAAETRTVQRQLADVHAMQNRIRGRATQIPPEQTNEIAIAICFPDQKPIFWKSHPTQSADDVWAFVANNDQMFGNASRPMSFAITFGTGNSVLDKTKTLADQVLICAVSHISNIRAFQSHRSCFYRAFRLLQRAVCQTCVIGKVVKTLEQI
jgi:hypothetical protein